jgi:prepilin-type N-terminal cleavage/methylation domain-containing protein
MTLVEVMMALVILAVLAVGSSAVFGHSFGMIETSRSKRLALDLASSRLDRLQSAGTSYADVAAASETEITVGPWPGSVTTEVDEKSESTMDGTIYYKEVTVTVSWIKNQQTNSVSLDTIVGKK